MSLDDSPTHLSSDLNKIQIHRPIYWTHSFLKTHQIDFKEDPLSNRLKNFVKKRCKCSAQKVTGFFPIIEMIRTYKLKTYLINDIIAGITVAFMQLPQGMAYALLSGLPPVIGLYMGFFPILFYAIFATSRHLSMGAIVVISLMVGGLLDKRFPDPAISSESLSNSTLNILKNKDGFQEETISIHEKTKFIMAVSIVAGFTQVAMGLLQLGFLVKLMSNSIVSAFSAGVAIYVITSQMKYILGITIIRYSGVLSVPYTWIEIFRNIQETNYREVLLSFVCIVILYLVKTQINERFKSRLPFPIPIDLIIIIIATLISHFLKLAEKYNFRVIGNVPPGLPTPAIPDFTYAKDYIGDSMVIALVAFVQSISVAILIARRKGYTIDANKELFAYGAANILSPIFGCYTAAGAVSRTSVQTGCGGMTQVASLFGALFVLIIIIAAGPLFKNLPNCVLSAVIFVSLRSLLKEPLKLPRLWRVCKYDFLLWIVTFFAVVLTRLELGLGIGIGFGILTILIRTLKLEAVSLGVINNTEIFVDKDKYKGVSITPGVTVIAFESPLYYANIDIFFKEIQKKFDITSVKTNSKLTSNEASDMNEVFVQMGNTKDADVEDYHHQYHDHHVILDCSGINFIDEMGADALLQVYEDYKTANIACHFSHLNDNVIAVLKASGAFKTLQHVLYLTTYDALTAANLNYEPITSHL